MGARRERGFTMVKFETPKALSAEREKATAATKRGNTKDPRLYQKAVFVGFRRGLRNQYNHTSLLRIQGVSDRKDVNFYLGKRCVYIYKAKAEKQGSKFRTIWGRVTAAHGNAGVVR